MTMKCISTTRHGRPEQVQHNYRDHSGMSERKGDSTASCHSTDRNFPVKLHYMLTELEKEGLSHIVSWQPHGRCFLVHKQKEFVQHILPLWFRQTKFASFQRQLNLYGFKRLTVGRDKNSYYHEYFLRGKRFLSNDIQRIKKKGNGARKPSSPLSEPDFYAMHYVLDTNEVMTYGRSDQMVSTIPRVEYVDRASSCDHFGGCLPESYVVHFPSSASALHTFAPRRMFPSESSVSQLFLPSLALSAVTNKAHYPSSAVSGAMLHMHAAMPPPTAAMLNEYSRHVRSADTQSQAGNQRASHVDHNFTPTKHQEYAHSIEHDQRLAAWIHYGGGGI